MQWCRLYNEFARDPKVQMMSEAMQRRLAMLFCFQSDGSLEDMDDDMLAFALRIDAAEVKKTKELFIKKGFIGKDSWTLLNWDKRQRPSDNVNERVKRYRERNGRFSNDSVTLQKPKKGGGGNVTKRLLAGAPPRDRPRPPLSNLLPSSLISSGSGGSPEGTEPPPPVHSTDSAEAVKVRDDAVRRWGAIDLDAEIQANELIRAWGAPLAAHGLNKAFRKFAGHEKPWPYAWTVCQSGMPRPASRGSSAPSPGENGASNTVTPSRQLAAEPPEPPLTTEQLRETVAMLEAIRKRLPWQETLLQQTREELAQRWPTATTTTATACAVKRTTISP